jgi:hypothetical protein
MTKVTILLPREVHRRVKLDCVARGVSMADAFREAIEQRWPEAA